VDHPSTLTSMTNLAAACWDLGKYKEAEALEVQVLETSKRVLGAGHPSTLSSMVNLAQTWKSVERDNEAMALMHNAANLQKEILGSDHPDTILSIGILNSWKR